jgi:hypothetical protein
MQEIATKSELLKVDRRGHVRVSKERRNALLDEFERCGVSARQFAEQIGVRYQTFATWRQRREQKRLANGMLTGLTSVTSPSVPTANEMRWMEAVIGGEALTPGNRPQPSNSVLHISLPGGARMEVGGVSQVVLAAELLRALEAKGRIAC